MLALAAVLVPVSTAPAYAARKAREDTSPLAVTLGSISPSVMPARGRITMTGTVTNRSDDVWTDLQVYLFHSDTPITTRAGLAQAAQTDPTADVGGRVTDEGLFDEIGDLAPGETTAYTVSVGRRDLTTLSSEPGVYWIGTHVLGAVDGIRDGLAAGRARSFIPLMPNDAPGTEVSVVLPLRDRVRRDSGGRLVDPVRWQRRVSDEGRLGRLAAFGAEADSLTWLVDPAVLDAVASVAADNPALSTAADGTGPDEGTAPPEPSTDASTEPAPEGTTAGDDEAVEELSAEAVQAAGWLDDFVTESSEDTVLGLPYGDLDVPAVTGNRLDGLLEEAQRLTAGSLATLGLDAAPVVAPPRGFLPSRVLDQIDPDTAVLMTDKAFPGIDATVLGRADGTRVALSDSAALAGGPGPDARRSQLALRQRLLSETALHALSPQRDRPVVVALPTGFNPAVGSGAAFFAGLDVPWLRQVGLDEVVDAGPELTASQRPLYPAGQRTTQIPLGNQLAAQELGELGQTYAELLTLNDSVGDELARFGLLAASYQVRTRAGAAFTRARETATRVRRTLQGVVIDGPSFVSMTNEVGPIAVTVENRLDETVTVRLEAQTRSTDLTISVPEAITLGPGQRTPVRMRARSSRIGVHNVTLVATTESGTAIGSQDQFNVRSSNIGTVIWFVMGGGLAMLGVAIVFRLVRRVRAHRRGPIADEATA